MFLRKTVQGFETGPTGFKFQLLYFRQVTLTNIDHRFLLYEMGADVTVAVSIVEGLPHYELAGYRVRRKPGHPA